MDVATPMARQRARPVRFVALERQHAIIQGKMQGAFVRLLCSSAFTLGEEVDRFEAEFAAYTEVAHCVGVASGTAALEAFGPYFTSPSYATPCPGVPVCLRNSSIRYTALFRKYESSYPT